MIIFCGLIYEVANEKLSIKLQECLNNPSRQTEFGYHSEQIHSDQEPHQANTDRNFNTDIRI